MRSVGFAAVLGMMALALAVPAAAKSPLTGEVCGSSGCVALSEPGALYDTLRWSGPFSLVSPPRPKAFYRLTFRSAEEFRWVVLWPRGASVICADDRAATPPIYGRAPSKPYWRTVSATVRVALARATAAMTPYRARVRWQVP